MSIQRRLNNISCKEYCNIHNFKYSIQKKEHFQKIYIPNYIDDSKANNYIEVIYPEIYIAELCNVDLVGGSSIIFNENNICIYDLPFMDNENRFDLAVNHVYYVDKNISLVRYEESDTVIEEGIMLISNASFNYFHFNLELLSKLCLIDKINEYNNFPILVDEVCLRRQSFKDELEMLNIHNRKIIPLRAGYHYNVKKLVYVSELLLEPINLRKDALLRYEDYMMNDLAVNPLHEKLSINSNPFRKLFISRKNCWWNHRLANHVNVEQIFKEHGFELICPEEMSFQDQLKAFSEAEFIAGACGAGFTNILFANKNAKIICILPKEVQLSSYSNISGILGQQNYYLDAKFSYNPNIVYYQNTYEVDENYLRESLKNI